MKRRSQKITTFFSAPAEPPAKRAAVDQGSMIQSTVTLSEVGSSSAASEAGSSSTAAGSSSAASEAGSLSEDGSWSTASEAGSSSTVSSQVSGRRVDGSKHRTGYDSRWEGDHTWIFYVEGEGMYCKLCRKFDTKNRQNQSKVWNREPCKTIRKDALARHEASTMHREAVEQERACQIVKCRGGIREAIEGQVVLQRNAVVGAMKCLYWLCKREIAHTTNFKPLLSLATSLGCTYLSALNVGGNAHYTSERIVQELVEILAQQIEDAQLAALARNSFYGLMIDESTDILVTKQLVLYGRYVAETGKPCSTFLKIRDLADGTAGRIEEAIRAYLADRELPMGKLMGFGSDGASVMTGRVSGVAARLRQSNPYLVAIHCVAHRLALACSQAGERIAYIQKFKKALTTLYWFFQASAVRTAGLKAIQEMFDTPSLKLKEAKDVRWLSHDLAVHMQTLRRSLPAVLTALEREGAEHGEPVAMGLVKVMKCYQFVACLHLMSEVLPHLSHLSRFFQAEYIQLSMVRPYLNACIESLTSYKDAVRAPDIAATDSALIGQLLQFNILVSSPEHKAAFDKNVRQPFLNLLKSYRSFSSS